MALPALRQGRDRLGEWDVSWGHVNVRCCQTLRGMLNGWMHQPGVQGQARLKGQFGDHQGTNGMWRWGESGGVPKEERED